jgi:hypothetical protein
MSTSNSKSTRSPLQAPPLKKQALLPNPRVRPDSLAAAGPIRTMRISRQVWQEHLTEPSPHQYRYMVGLGVSPPGHIYFCASQEDAGGETPPGPERDLRHPRTTVVEPIRMHLARRVRGPPAP